MDAEVVVFWEWLMDLHSSGDIWSSDQFMGHHKRPMRTHQHFFWGTLSIPPFPEGTVEIPPGRTSPGRRQWSLFSKSSHFASSAGVLAGDVRVFDCYELSPTQAEDFILGRCEMAATKHSLAVAWQPQISETRPSEGNFTFWCRVEAITPRV